MKNFVDLIFASVILSICFYTCSCKPIFVDVDFVDADATVQNMFSKAQTETAVFELAVSKELTKQAPTLTDSTEYDQNISSAMTPEPGDFTEEELQEIRPLIDQIKENPDDPFPRFKLGITYLETDRPQLARDSFQNGFKLSEDNPQAILEIGDQLSDLNIWTYAAYSYLLVHKLGSPIPPEELQDKINEALYHAAFEDYSLEVSSPGISAPFKVKQQYEKNVGHTIEVRLGDGDRAETIAFLERTWNEFTQDAPFQYSWMEEEFDQMFATERRTSQILVVFSLLSIFITCLGLLGLISYTTNQRTREIGIRKIMGASEEVVMRLLSREVVNLLIISGMISIPAYFGARAWLQKFAYHIDFQVAVFFLVLFLVSSLVLILAMLTVSFHSYRAATANPAESIRSE